MTKDFSERGYWWVPGKEHRVPGIFQFSLEDGVSLEVDGALDPREGLETIQRRDWANEPCILGFTRSGDRMTLVGCFRVFRSVGKISRETWGVGLALLGRHLSSADSRLWRRMDVTYSHLDEWAAMSGIRCEATKGDDGESEKSVRYKKPAGVEGRVDPLRITVESTDAWNLGGFEVKVTESAILRVQSEQPISFDEWMAKCLWPMQQLIGFATDARVRTTTLKFYCDDDTEAGLPGGVDGGAVRAIITQRNVATGSRVYPHEMLFSLPEVANRFDDFLARWFALTHDLESVCSQMFAVRQVDGMLVNHQFLSMAQAVESYHSRHGQRRHVMPPPEHRQRKSEVLCKFDGGVHEWLKEKLAYSNEPTLYERLIDILERVAPALPPLIPDPRAFARKITDTRNYYTHYSSGLKKKAADGVLLWRYAQALSFILAACILLDLGFQPEECKMKLNNNPQYWPLRDALQDAFPVS